MSQKTVFARARPSTIRVTENYPYKTEISTVSRTDPEQGRVGLIEISVPYDGWKHVSRQVLKDIKKQKKQTKDVTEARIGHLSFNRYDRTNLDEKHDLSLRHSVLPLDIPLDWNKSRQLNDLCDDRYVCNMVLSYTPEQLEINPLSVILKIYDETEIEEQKEVSEEKENYIQRQPTQSGRDKRVAEQISEQIGFERSLVFEFSLELKLLKHIEPVDKKPPILRRIVLEWPVNTSRQLVELSLDPELSGRKPTIIYDPKHKVIEWSDVPFERDNTSSSENVYTFRTPRMFLSVKEPGELYQVRELSGSVRIEIPYLYSGMRLSYLDASGEYDGDMSVEYYTVLTSHLKLDVSTCFDRKVYSPYQYLQFPNVILNEMRRADVIALLKDQLFTCLSKKPSDLLGEIESGKQYLIEATRPEGAGTLTLWILLQGTPSNTKREKKIPGEETFTTSLDTGNTDVYIRGQLQGDSMRVVAVINEIHERLKERFRHVSVLD